MEQDFESQLQEAIRRRILEEIGSARQAQIINNVYGGGGKSDPEGQGVKSLQEAMTNFNPKDYNYFVDIEREDVLGPEGEKLGWKKRVKRYADPKEKMISELFGAE
jgi:hypothetical protein